MKLCVFQGSFNPIHNAHLRVAEYVCSKYNFDKILFIPAFNPPHKELDSNMAYHRFEMVKLAIKDYQQFCVSDIEYKRQGISYTYQTIKELYKIHNIEGKIHFIIGTDAFEKIKSWYEIDKLKELVKFIVFIREDRFEISRYNELKKAGYDFEFQNLSYLDVSSTEIRQKIKNNDEVSDLLPPEVKEYILKNELYKY
ncbi:nicotinate-nucleotide adenylyltransferase [bacterium]|nr:nicotinate-nucleotide adenylyltransferase [bacterium]